MAKITRLFHKIFGANAIFSTQMGKFGSLKNGTPEYATNASDIQSLSNWEGGLYESIIGNNSPVAQDINAALHHTSRQVGYLMQQGIPEYDSSTTYYIGSYCTYNGIVYKSITDDNINHTPTLFSSYWKSEDNSLCGVILPYAPFGSAPYGFLKCDGSAISRSSYSRLFTKMIGSESCSISSSSPAVVTVPSGLPLYVGMQITFDSPVPTGLTPQTVYYITNIGSTTFNVCSTYADAKAGTNKINTSGEAQDSAVYYYPWGAGDGSTTFNIPNLQGAFLRGTGTGTINGRNKSGPSVGNFSEDEIQGHVHYVAGNAKNVTAGSAGICNQPGTTESESGFPIGTTYGTPRYGSETKPYCAGVTYIIKY